MKTYQYTLLALSAFLLAAVSAGCSDEFEPAPETDAAADCFNISVSVPLNAVSRAADDPLNEFKVNSLHLFFYSNAEHDDDTSAYLFDYVTTQSFEFSKTLRINLSSDDINDLFGELGTECMVYAVANVDESSLSGRNTVSELKATVVSSMFDQTVVQPAFAMDGTAQLTLDRTNRSVSGSIQLQRAAAKLTLALNVPESIDVTETEINPQDGSSWDVKRTYYPKTELMHVWMGNGVKKSLLNTAPTPAEAGFLYSNEISAAEGVGSSFSANADLPDFPFTQSIPFYSYPNEWLASNPSGNSRLTLVIPWYYLDEQGKQKSIVTYYRMSVQPGKNRIERNTHYDMRVSISRLGSTSIQSPLEISSLWSYALPWNSQNFLTDIKNIRYLLLNTLDYDAQLRAFAFTMNNDTEISIPYNSSHPVQINKVTLSWRDYAENKDRDIQLFPVSSNKQNLYSSFADYNPDTHFAAIEIDPVTSTIKLKRNMRHLYWNEKARVVEITKNDAINSYNFDIVLSHADQSTQSVKVRITQIPDIYITTQLTDMSTRFINNNNEIKNINKGYVSDNHERDNIFYLGPIEKIEAAVNNKRSYIIAISKFNADEKDYIIGDTRSFSVNNLPIGSASVSAPAAWSMESVSSNSPGLSRMLTNYYPADNSGNKENYIAPKIRVASQWGITKPIKYETARRRCASYQEDGRPAGRWRLPTVAEISFIANLSSKGYIPYLFGAFNNTEPDYGTVYWCASGAVIVYNFTSSPGVHVEPSPQTYNFARCVYDEWYWGNDTLVDKTVFTWGDKPRSFSGNL